MKGRDAVERVAGKTRCWRKLTVIHVGVQMPLSENKEGGINSPLLITYHTGQNSMYAVMLFLLFICTSQVKQQAMRSRWMEESFGLITDKKKWPRKNSVTFNEVENNACSFVLGSW